MNVLLLAFLKFQNMNLYIVKVPEHQCNATQCHWQNEILYRNDVERERNRTIEPLHLLEYENALAPIHIDNI